MKFFKIADKIHIYNNILIRQIFSKNIHKNYVLTYKYNFCGQILIQNLVNNSRRNKIYCSKCGRKTKSDKARFCSYCGSPINGNQNNAPHPTPQTITNHQHRDDYKYWDDSQYDLSDEDEYYEEDEDWDQDDNDD